MTGPGLTVASARPYPWPYDGAALPGRTALVVVAAQEAFVPRCAGAAEALVRIGGLAEAARAWGASIVATRHGLLHPSGRAFSLPVVGSAGWRLALAGPEPDAVVDAHGLDGFCDSPLASYLAARGLDHLLVCGLGLEGPVHSTLRSANDRGLECLVVTDACASFDPRLAGAAVRMIEMSGGIFGAVAALDSLHLFPESRRYEHVRPR